MFSIDDPFLKRHVKAFAERHGFNPLETETLMMMACGFTSFNGLSESLKASQEATCSHLDMMFTKAKVLTESALLIRFLRDAVSDSSSHRFFAKKPRVLVVDDEPEICELIQMGLEDREFKVLVESNPLKAVETALAHRFDFIISDICMPKVDGMQLMRRVREVFPHSPLFFFISGFSMYGSEQCLAAGAKSIFQKPFDLDVIFNRLMEHYVESDFDNSRPCRTVIDRPVTLHNTFNLQVRNVGFGGAFVAIDNDIFPKLNVKKGDVIPMRFSLKNGGPEFVALGEIAWTREQCGTSGPSGAGVRFREMSTDHHSALTEFVRLNRILSFIPSGLNATEMKFQVV